MPGFRCPNDQTHDTFRLVVRRAQRLARFVDRRGNPRLDEETILDAREEVLEAVCAECGAMALVLNDALNEPGQPMGTDEEPEPGKALP